MRVLPESDPCFFYSCREDCYNDLESEADGMIKGRQMNLKNYDGKYVRITTVSKEDYEGLVSYLNKEYVFHEYGQNEEVLYLTPILFYKNDISDIVSLEDVSGPFGHFSQEYGLLERKCLEWGDRYDRRSIRHGR